MARTLLSSFGHMSEKRLRRSGSCLWWCLWINRGRLDEGRTVTGMMRLREFWFSGSFSCNATDKCTAHRGEKRGGIVPRVDDQQSALLPFDWLDILWFQDKTTVNTSK